LQSSKRTDDSVARRQWLLFRSQCENTASLSSAELKSDWPPRHLSHRLSSSEAASHDVPATEQRMNWKPSMSSREKSALSKLQSSNTAARGCAATMACMPARERISLRNVAVLMASILGEARARRQT